MSPLATGRPRTTDRGPRAASGAGRAGAEAARRLGAVVLALLLAAPAVGQGAGVFARMGMGARSVALPAQVADLSGRASPYLNPALAPFQPSQGVEFSAGLLTFDRTWEAVQVAAPLQPRSGFAGGVVHGGVDNIDGRNGSGEPVDARTADGTYATDEYAFFAAFGTRFSEAVSAGIGMRLYRNELLRDVRAPTAIGVSAGLAARLSPRLTAGLAVDDLFARYEWSAAGTASATDYFPIRLRGGATYAAGALPDGRPRVLVAAEAEAAFQPAETTRPSGVRVIGGGVVERDTTLEVRLGDVQARLGVEAWLAEPIAVRLGVDRVGAEALRPSAGFGLQQRFGELDTRIDYAAVLEPFGTGVMHMATVRLGL